jgi:hypothetical protein
MIFDLETREELDLPVYFTQKEFSCTYCCTKVVIFIIILKVRVLGPEGIIVI